MESKTFYNVYGIERVGRLSGQRFLGEYDWYRDGCRLLTGIEKSERLGQRSDGSWSVKRADPRREQNLGDGWPIVSTSFALLFLSKGRTPILISKLAYDADELGTTLTMEWNNKHHDVKNLVDYSSRQLFDGFPLAWQIYDPRMLGPKTDAEIRLEVGELRQSPILYITGHHSLKLTDQQKKIVKMFVEEGGFIMAESCCGKEAFTNSFRKLMEEMFPENPLRPLPEEHPVWRAHALVEPSRFTKLEGIERGCKTVVIFSPEPLAGYWEESRFAPTINVKAQNRGEHAWRLAGNIIAYATGLERPKPRLTVHKVSEPKDSREVPRSFLKVAQLKHSGEFQPAPQAMHNLMGEVRKTFGIDVSLKREVISMSHPDLAQYKFMYMHGRNDFHKDLDDSDVEGIQTNLRTGGLLLADACCGRKEFDKAFREFVKKLYPDKKLEPIPTDDILFSEKLNGKPIKTVRVRREKPDGTTDPKATEVPPELEGVKVDGRWVIIYSKYDLGCALEKTTSIDCKGHDYESAVKIGSAAVLYFLKQ
jgi:hypothetical protein